MKKFKARKEREQQEAIVRPRVEIEDPSDELFSRSREWDHDDPLQDSFLEQPEKPQVTKDYHRAPKLKFRKPLTPDRPRSPYEEGITDYHNQVTTPIASETKIEADSSITDEIDISFINFDDSESEEIVSPLESPMLPSPTSQHRPPPQISRIIHVPLRLSSLHSPKENSPLSTSPPKTDFQSFSQKCAPSPISTTPPSFTPVFELSADEMISPIKQSPISEEPAELEGSPVDTKILVPAPLHVPIKPSADPEPEASPYSRFTTFTKSIHALNASLSPIEETEEEAASRRSSIAQIYELPALAPLNPIPPSAYNGGSSIISRNRYTIGAFQDLAEFPSRNTSTRSSTSSHTAPSEHSLFSFEYTNSDTEKIFVPQSIRRRNSSAPSLTDVSSLDDFDVDLEIDLEKRQSRPALSRDAKLERFFGIRQYSVGSKSDLTLTSDTGSSGAESPDAFPVTPFKPSHKHARSPVSIDDLDLSLALENNPYRREIMMMHKSILSKSMSKQDAKLEKFFGCNKNVIALARKTSTGSRLAGTTDDLKYRSIGW